jgi:Eukaryotic aspartyl protease
MFHSYSFHALLLASQLFQTQAVVLPRSDASSSRIHYQNVKPFDKPTAFKKTDNYVTLQKRAGISKSSAYLHEVRNARNHQKRQVPNTPLTSAASGSEYLTQITFGSTPVQVIVDTGSSDTWLIESAFQCVDVNGNAQAQSVCNFGPAYPGTFGANQIPNVNFNISYGDGEFVTGVFGTTNITIAGITVPSQTVRHTLSPEMDPKLIFTGCPWKLRLLEWRWCLHWPYGSSLSRNHV